MKPGDGGSSAITPGKPADSLLLKLITSPDPDQRMPRDDQPLVAEQVRLIEQWIAQGATFDGPDPKAELSTLFAVRHPAAPLTYRRPVPILALAFSPDGKELAASGYHEVTFWEPSSGKLLGRLGNIAQQTHALAYSPDGALLIVAGGTPGVTGELRLLDPARRSGIATLDRAGDTFLAASFTPDGARLAAAGADSAVRLYDVSRRKRLLSVEPHADWVTALAFTPDGRRLLTASRDKTARLLDAATGEVQATYTAHADAPLAAAVPGKDSLLTGGRDRKLHLWRAQDAKKTAEIGPFDGDVLRIIAGKEFIFIACSDRKVRQYRADNRSLVRELPHDDWVCSIALHEASGRLAAASHGGDVRLWNVNDGRMITSFIAAPGLKPASTAP
jgi:WD40 repeat protein